MAVLLPTLFAQGARSILYESQGMCAPGISRRAQETVQAGPGVVFAPSLRLFDNGQLILPLEETLSNADGRRPSLITKIVSRAYEHLDRCHQLVRGVTELLVNGRIHSQDQRRQRARIAQDREGNLDYLPFLSLGNPNP